MPDFLKRLQRAWLPALAMVIAVPAVHTGPLMAQAPPAGTVTTGIPVGGDSVEQRRMGADAGVRLVRSFDGLGAGFVGPHGAVTLRNPSDNSLAVGRTHIVQTVNSQWAIFRKDGTPVYGPLPTNAVFKGFGGACEEVLSGDAVVRYDQLADRWLLVLPIFRRVAARTGAPGPRTARLVIPPAVTDSTVRPLPPRGSPDTVKGDYAMCYAVSATSNPLGAWHRYEFTRPLFPDYPRPAVWPDGYYVPTSTGDEVVEKHLCVVERRRMLRGLSARELCRIVPGVNFLNTADLDGQKAPAPGAPHLILAAGGTQLRGVVESAELQLWRFSVNWRDTSKTVLRGPESLAVAPYRYMCGGQLTNCVPQPGTERRLDSQGDKLMPRLVYRRMGTHDAMVAVHSINTAQGTGGVRWYELRVSSAGNVVVHQQGTYAPDSLYRWLPSAAMDRFGNIGIGYSAGDQHTYPGQRFAGRTPQQPPGTLGLREATLVNGAAPQSTTLRWEDYTQTAVDPVDDCTIWYVGDYLRAGATFYSTRIGAFRLPGCR
jgi:hypothetical protein